MPSLVERDRPWETDKKDRFATIRPEKLTVGNAFQKEQACSDKAQEAVINIFFSLGVGHFG